MVVLFLVRFFHDTKLMDGRIVIRVVELRVVFVKHWWLCMLIPCRLTTLLILYCYQFFIVISFGSIVAIAPSCCPCYQLLYEFHLIIFSRDFLCVI